MTEEKYSELYREYFRISPAIGDDSRDFLRQVTHIRIGDDSGDAILRDAIRATAREWLKNKSRRDTLTPGLIEISAAFWRIWNQRKTDHDNFTRQGGVCNGCGGVGLVCVALRKNGDIFIVGRHSWRSDWGGFASAKCPFCTPYRSGDLKKIVMQNSKSFSTIDQNGVFITGELALYRDIIAAEQKMQSGSNSENYESTRIPRR